jgi:formate hydrogenlyase subunit 6/NADH:ubiquinone oxidoreductase subunit I
MDRVLGWLFKQVEVTPEYHVGRCLAVKGTGCTACADACPHEAITITRRVAIDAIDCTGCGICVDVCPTGALEARGEAPVAATVRCSMVEGDASSVICLARLAATDLLRSAESGGAVLLAHGACAACSVGDASVPERIHATAERARELAAVTRRPLDVRIEERERLDHGMPARQISRRDLLRTSGDGAKRVASSALAPLERLAGDDDAAAALSPLPRAWHDTLLALRSADLAADVLVPARLPRIEPGCILCPSCTRACPTDALKRVFEEGGGTVLHLDPERCVGCDACMEVCPVDVIRMDDRVTWGELSGGSVTVAEGGLRGPSPGGVTR